MNEILKCRWADSRRMIAGHRVYRERRGLWHVQHPVKPSNAWYTGTVREIEAALKTRSVRV